MAEVVRKIVFANKKLEEDFTRLAASMHPEDRKAHAVLQIIQDRLRTQYRLGHRLPKDEVASVYRLLFGVGNLWRLDVPPYGAVLYSTVGAEIWIVDIL